MTKSGPLCEWATTNLAGHWVECEVPSGALLACISCEASKASALHSAAGRCKQAVTLMRCMHAPLTCIFLPATVTASLTRCSCVWTLPCLPLSLAPCCGEFLLPLPMSPEVGRSSSEAATGMPCGSSRLFDRAKTRSWAG